MSSTSAVNPNRPRLTSAVKTMAALSAAVLFVQLTLVSHADMASWLGFDADNLPGRWWSVLTYAFVHRGVWHLAANMYGLLAFGPRIERGWGTRRFVWLYLVCAVGGALLHMLFVRGSVLVGSSAAVFGIMTAYAMQWPNETVYAFGLRTRARTVIAALIAINVAIGVLGTGDGANLAYVAQLGGILAAYAYMRMPDGGAMEQVRQKVAELPEENEPPRAIPRTLPRQRERLEEADEIVAKSKALASQQPAVATPVKRSARRHKAEELDRVLDKISQHGIESLTEEERKVLEDMSARLRRGD